MKLRRWVSVCFAGGLALGCGVAASSRSSSVMGFDLPPIDGTPPANVNSWIRITWLGPITHPIIPVYFFISKSALPKKPLTAYVEMSSSEYQSLQKFDNSAKCDKWKPPYQSSIRIVELEHSRLHDGCVLPRADACTYFFGLAQLSSIDWPRKDTWPISDFEYELGCAKPLAPAHDANGHSY